MTDTTDLQNLSFDLECDLPHRELSITKWSFVEEDVLPAWVADMDFPSPPAISEAIKQRADAACYGYTIMPPKELPTIIVERMKRLYDWDVKPEELVFIPGMVLALNIITGALGKAGDGVLMQTPVYGPFLRIPETQGLFANMVDMVRVQHDKHTFHYEVDMEAFESAITPQTKFFYLCNPHNPGGRAFTREELAQMHAICQRHDVTIMSDEIHADLLLGDSKHIPIASLDEDSRQRTITLIAPSKTYNIPGLACSVAIVQDEATRKRIEDAAQRMGVHVNIMGFIAAHAGYAYGDGWLKEVLAYITANRDYVVDYIGKHMPQLRCTVPEATYLLWIDCSALDLPEGKSAQEFFVEKARVALSPGSFFGKAGEPFVRLNLASRRDTLEQIMARMAEALA
jgi:cystathionine beta-lyase